MDRVTTGVAGLDTMLGGGLVAGRPYVVSGPTGSGKTILAMHFLASGLAQGESGLMVTLDEPPNEVKSNVTAFGWNLDRLKILDATPDIKAHKRSRSVIDVGTTLDVRDMEQVGEIRQSSQIRALEVSVHGIQKMLKQEFFQRLEKTKQRYKRIVVDSLTALKMFSMQGEDSRIMIQSFLRFLSELEATSLIVSERLHPTTLETEFFLARGEIRFHKWLDGNVIRRAVSIEKFRGSRFDDRIRPMTISNAGLLVEQQGSVTIQAGRLATLGSAYLEQRIGEEVSTVIEGVLKLIEDANRIRVPATDVEHAISRAMLQLQRRNYQKALKAALNAQSILRERLDRAKQALPPPPPPPAPPPPGVRR
jgi:KaiC/GvpD/RAD55 family RecA-like ATPase